jgi:pilus assembly protein CpaE
MTSAGEKDPLKSQAILTVRVETRSHRLRNQMEGIVASVGGLRVKSIDEKGGCDLFIVDSDEQNKELKFVNNIISSGVAREVFLTSQDKSPDILIEAMRVGVKEFIPQPIQEEDLRIALLKFKARAEKETAKVATAPARKGKIINVLGSKGGVGTTTVAVNLATGLAGTQGVRSVALLDMNLLYGEIPLFLGIDPTFDWMELAKNISRLDATYLMSTLHKHPCGVHVLPSPSKLIDESKITPQIIEQLLRLMHSMFDYVVIDGGQSFDEVSKMIMRMSDKVMLVTLLSLPCLINVKRLRSAFLDLGYPSEEKVEIIVNRFHKNSIVSLEEAEKNLEKKFIWTIPNDYQTTMSAINQGKPVMSLKNESPLIKNFLDFASIISGKSKAKKEGFSWFGHRRDKK